MSKRLRQASIFEAVCSKKRHVESDSVCTDKNEESPSTGPPLDSGMAQDQRDTLDTGMVQDETEAELVVQEDPSHEESKSECLSSCCTDKTKPYQPTNKIILSSMARNGRNLLKNGSRCILG